MPQQLRISRHKTWLVSLFACPFAARGGAWAIASRCAVPVFVWIGRRSRRGDAAVEVQEGGLRWRKISRSRSGLTTRASVAQIHARGIEIRDNANCREPILSNSLKGSGLCMAGEVHYGPRFAWRLSAQARAGPKNESSTAGSFFA